VTASSAVISSASMFTSLLAGDCLTTHLLLQLTNSQVGDHLTPTSYSTHCRHKLKTLSQSQSQSYIATDGQSISKPWCRVPSGAHDQIFITLRLLQSCFCGALSLTRGRVCLFCSFSSVCSPGTNRIENIFPNSSSIVASRNSHTDPLENIAS
jgi:hypothetical protein